ncbi:MAG: C10 family peptidase [Chitinispirillales bacterium]|jgi:hypothetical protein|nr:C10 family peptidase [Chitinispirillales bacterium]
MQSNGKIFKIAAAICIAVVLAIPITTQAKPVELKDAQTMAQRFTESKRGQSTKANVQLKHTAKKQGQKPGGGSVSGNVAQSAPDDIASYYVFNINEDAGGGFVIVAGDDAVKPILGYCENGSYDENDLPPNFAYWMNYLQEQIVWAQEQNIPQSENIRQEWESYMAENVPVTTNAASAVSPLIQTKWDQTSPYNNMCPTDGGNRSVTGCVATAMAQIMKYYNHPLRGNGQSLSYTGTDGVFVPSVNFGATTYDWSNMQDTYTSSAADTPQNNAVATLMYHCGASVKMNYGFDASGAYSSDVPLALTTYFGYDKSIQRKQRQHYGDEEWEAMLTGQIDAGLPVYYNGEDTIYGGHAFILDGYDESGRFHFNWGWGGSQDGYFVTTMLNPNIYKFNQGHGIIIDIKPDEGGVAFGYEFALTGLSSNKNTAFHNDAFTVSISRLSNESVLGIFPGGQLNVALVDDSGNILALTATASKNIGSLPNGYVYSDLTFNCVAPNTIALGQYKLRIVTRPTGGDWKIVTVGNPNSIDFTIVCIDAQEPTISVQPLDTAVIVGENYALSVSASVTDGGTLSYQWFSNTSASNSGGAVIIDETDSCINVPADILGTYYYYVEVTNTNDYATVNKTVTTTSDAAAVTVNSAVPNVVWPVATTITYGNALSTSTLSGGSATGTGDVSILGVFAWDDGLITPTVTNTGYGVTFTPDDNKYLQVTKDDLAITVNKATPAYTETAPTNMSAIYGETLADVAELPSGWSWMIPATLVGAAGEQTHKAKFTPIDVANYNVVENIDVKVNVAKAIGATVTAPVFASKTYNSVTINEIVAPANGQVVNYAINTLNAAPADAVAWKTALTFTGLLPDKDYYIFARTAENANYKSGAVSSAIHVTTDADGANPIFKDKNPDRRSGIRLSSNIVSDKATIAIDLPNNERVSQMKAVFYDNTGNVVFEAEGRGGKIEWNLTNNAGRNAANGTYLAVIEARGNNGKTYKYSTKIGVRR